MPASIFSWTKSLTAAIITLFFLFMPHPSSAADWYVSATLGSDTTGDGSQWNPYLTIGKAVQTAANNDRILVSEGTYFESVSLDKILTFLGGYDPLFLTRIPSVHRTVIDGGGSATANLSMLWPGSLSLHIDGFILQNSARGLEMTIGDYPSVTLSNNVIRNHTEAGIWIGPSPPLLPGYYIITNIYSSNNLIIGNEIGIKAYSPTTGYMGIPEYFGDIFLQSRNDTISSNHQGLLMEANFFDSYWYHFWSTNRHDIRNSIIWENSLNNFTEGAGTRVYNYSDVQGGAAGTGNLNSDPLFFDPDLTDHQLQPGSPAINAGDPAPAYNDPDGSRNDMGFTGGPDGAWADGDHDGMADAWETYYGLDPLDPADAIQDWDGDLIINRDEFYAGTPPGFFTDTDGDGMTDFWETLYSVCGLNPAVGDSLGDPDFDLLPNLEEFIVGSDPCDPDTDADLAQDGSDCNPLNPNNWVSCPTCADADADARFAGCDAYVTINGPDCDDENQNTWGTCVTCNDDDTDLRFELCNQYIGIQGPDCDDLNPNTWNSCLTCQDSDSDYWFYGCNQYATVNGPDCNDANANTWNTCATCVDADGDYHMKICDQYLTVNGPDCNDANSNTWDTCATCLDSDADSWFGVCNQYAGINGPDCDDTNIYAWDTCESCLDNDEDGSFTICNQYTPVPSTIGTGVGTWYFPLRTSYHDARTQVIYLASEIGRRGRITAVALEITTIPGQVMENFTIRMKHTTLTSYASAVWEDPSSGWVTVYQNNEPRGTTGWRNFTLSTPFIYNGTDNLMVDFSFNNSSSTTSGYVRYTLGASYRSVYGASNSTSGNPLDWPPTPYRTSYFPNLRVIFGATGPDCDDMNTNVWDNCTTCADLDSDLWFSGCDRYQTINGPDCDEANPNTWNSCATCFDTDGDSRFSGCNQYLTVNGPDCDDANHNTWDTCETCIDVDKDGWVGICNQYAGINGPDCDDGNPQAWDTCETCHDLDSDGYLELCNRYLAEITVGAGTDSWNLPLMTNWHDARTQTIYLASELGGAGQITALALDVTTAPSMVMNNFTIRMKHTPLSSYPIAEWNEPVAEWTTVYQNNEPPGTTGWRTFLFTTPFIYNGADNLMVDISFNNSSYGSAGACRYTTAPSPRSLWYTTDSGYGDPLEWPGAYNPSAYSSTNVPNLRLTVSVQGGDCDDSIETGASCHDTCSIFFQDQDSDLFGDTASSSTFCSLPSGYVADDTDCGPENADVYPAAPELCDEIDNQCPGDAGYGTVDEGCAPVDSDGDGMLDSEENAAGTSLLDWDTDGDGLSDYLEHNTSGLDPLNSADGLGDLDADQNPNVHEIYNGTGLNDPDPQGHFISTELGCCYFADVDGDGVLGPNDIAGLENDILGLGADYSGVIPPTGLTMDADGDGGIGPGDLSEANNMLLGLPLAYIGGRADSLVVLDSPAGPVAAGDTCRVTIGVRNEADLGYAQGFAVIFEVVSGDAAILGGDGSASFAAPGNRYDFSGASGSSSIVIRPNASGTITIDAYIPACGTPGMGRSCAEINLAAPVQITTP